MKDKLELGEVLEVKLTSSTQTTWLIDALRNPFRPPITEREKHQVDTLILKNIYSVWKGPAQGYLPGNIGYGISLLLQEGFYGSDTSVKTSITFTWLKQYGTNKVFHVDEKTSPYLIWPIIEPIIEKIKARDDMEQGQETIIPFNKPIALNAQSAYMHMGEWGRTTQYYFVGMKVWRFH